MANPRAKYKPVQETLVRGYKRLEKIRNFHQENNLKQIVKDSGIVQINLYSCVRMTRWKSKLKQTQMLSILTQNEISLIEVASISAVKTGLRGLNTGHQIFHIFSSKDTKKRFIIYLSLHNQLPLCVHDINQIPITCTDKWSTVYNHFARHNAFISPALVFTVATLYMHQLQRRGKNSKETFYGG